MMLRKKGNIMGKIDKISKNIGQIDQAPLTLPSTVQSEKTPETGFSLFKRKSK